MVTSPKLMMSFGIAVAGLGLIGAGAGATFTAQVAGNTTITTGEVGLSLNGRTGHDLQLEVDGRNLSPHFDPISEELRLGNTGSLDLLSTDLDVTATGCNGGDGAPLARSLRITVTDVTHSRQVYDGALCSAADEQLPHPLAAGGSDLYELVLRPSDAVEGLSADALDCHTSVRVVFTGTDF